MDKNQRKEKKSKITIADRIILGFIAYLIVEIYFANYDTRTYLKDIPSGMAKRVWVILLIIPLFITFLVISHFPRVEKRLRPSFRIIY